MKSFHQTPSLRPFIEDYTTLSSIYAVVQNAYAKKVYVDHAFQTKTKELVSKTYWRQQSPKHLLSSSQSTNQQSNHQEPARRRCDKSHQPSKAIQNTAEKKATIHFLIALAGPGEGSSR